MPFDFSVEAGLRQARTTTLPLTKEGGYLVMLKVMKGSLANCSQRHQVECRNSASNANGESKSNCGMQTHLCCDSGRVGAHLAPEIREDNVMLADASESYHRHRPGRSWCCSSSTTGCRKLDWHGHAPKPTV